MFHVMYNHYKNQFQLNLKYVQNPSSVTRSSLFFFFPHFFTTFYILVGQVFIIPFSSEHEDIGLGLGLELPGGSVRQSTLLSFFSVTGPI